MTISELEPFVLFKKLKPIHLFLKKGKAVKWLVCIEENDETESQRLVVYDAEGHAYSTHWKKGSFSEEELEKMTVRKNDLMDMIMVGKYATDIYPWLDYDAEWYAKARKTKEMPCTSRETQQENTSSRT